MTKDEFKNRLTKNLDQIVNILYSYQPDPDSVGISVHGLIEEDHIQDTVIVRMEFDRTGRVDVYDAYRQETDLEATSEDDMIEEVTPLLPCIKEIK